MVGVVIGTERRRGALAYGRAKVGKADHRGLTAAVVVVMSSRDDSQKPTPTRL
jgi:hypothetical protein